MWCERAFNRNDSSRPITRPSSTGKRRAYNYPGRGDYYYNIAIQWAFNYVNSPGCLLYCGRPGEEKNQHNAFAARRDVYIIIILFIHKDARVPARNLWNANLSLIAVYNIPTYLRNSRYIKLYYNGVQLRDSTRICSVQYWTVNVSTMHNIILYCV